MEQTKKVHECGCIMSKEDNAWHITEYCKQHEPNWQKRADKVIRENQKNITKDKLRKERRKKW